MNRTVFAAVTAMIVAVGGNFAATAGEYSGPGFSGIAWFGENGAADQEIGHMYVDRAGFRMETRQDDQHMAVLAYWDQETAYTLMLDQKMYMEVPAEQTGSTAADFDGKPCDGYENAKMVGPATVNGRATEKWRCTGELDPVPGEQPADSTSWFDPELGFPVREVKDNGDAFEVRNIKVARQDASLFEVPAGYQKLDINAIMQQMMQQQGQ
ncbi:MAG: DUF4412 domain-containing protein [Alphaproteobacteria bacterium]|nr:DUF4412 domain-containing protein [Alphaproteobacteria bacterium]